MAKVSGLGAAIKVADASGTPQAISNDITDYNFATPRAVQDTTGVDKFAHERLLLLGDYTVTLKGVTNYAANMSHAVFSTISSTSVQRSVEIDPIGTTTGNPKLTVNCVLTDYQFTRANTGADTFSVPGSLADGNTPTWTTN